MHIERHGSGPRIFLGLHGWSGNHATFDPLTAHLPEDVTFYAADLPGCGASPAPRAWTVDAVVDEIVEAIASFSGPVCLVGNCTGANLAFFAAQRAPHLIRRVVALDVFATWPWYFRVFVNPQIGRYAYFTTFANPVGRWLTDRSLRNRRGEETSLTNGFQRVDHDATYRYLTLLRGAGAYTRFRDLQMPIDLAYGEKSFRAVRESAELFSAMWTNARVHRLAGAGHLPIQEATSAVGDLLFRADRGATESNRSNTEDPWCRIPSTSSAA